MNLLLKDILLSFCPVKARKNRECGSTVRVLRAAGIAGLLQVLVFGAVQIVRYRHFLGLRLEQLAPVVVGSSEAVQSAGFMVITFEFLLQPLSLLFTYFFLEGCVRAIAAALFDEPLPTLPVFIGFAATAALKRNKAGRRLASLPPDSIEFLERERVRIAGCLIKSGWNSTMTISIDGQWYEVEQEEQGRPPRIHVYVLKKASLGRVLRGFEEYDASSAVQLSRE